MNGVHRRSRARLRTALVVALALTSLASCNGAESEAKIPRATAFVVHHDVGRGRIGVENNVLRLEFGYKAEAGTHWNQSGGNLYYYYDKRFSPTQNIISVWESGTAGTKAYASGAGGIGSTQVYAAPDLQSIGRASYQHALADNARDSTSRTTPYIQRLPNGSLRIQFDLVVANRDWKPSYEWYTVHKTWTITPTGRIAFRQHWRISRSGYFSEPATRNQISTAFQVISRWGHTWSDAVARRPGSNSRKNPANRWYHWVPTPSSIRECNASDGRGGSQDAVHADYNRFHGGAPYDFWFWPENGGRGFEGLGQYEIGFKVFGKSEGASVNEICHHNRKLVGDGADAYNLGVMGWWGGDIATVDRYMRLTAGTTWTDSYQMEARPRGDSFPR